MKGGTSPQARDEEMLIITTVIVGLAAKNWTLGIPFSDLAGKTDKGTGRQCCP